MIFKLIILIAVIILIAAMIGVSVKVGIGIGRARQRRAADSVDPVLHAELAHFARTVLAPPAEVDDVVVLPSWMRKKLGEPLLEKLNATARTRRASRRPWQLPD